MSNALNTADFDPMTRPADDLFRHANGRWLDTTEIPDDRSRWGAFDALREAADAAVRDIITGLVPDDDPTTEASKIANLYASFMDEDRIEALGASPLAPILDRVAAIDSVPALCEFLGWSVRYGINPLFELGNDADPGDPKRYLMFVGQGGIGLPDEEYYRLDDKAEIRAKYLAHIARGLTLAGLDDAAAQADAVLSLETEIAACHWDKVKTRDMVQMYHLQTWEQFTDEVASLDWDAFLTGADLPASAVKEVVNCQRTFPGEVVRLVTADRLPEWRSWARWQVVNSMSPWLSTDFVAADFDFYRHELLGVPEIKPRWKRGVSLTQSVLGEAIGKVYVAKWFTEPVKARADELVANLVEAYRRSITELDWMTDATKAEALLKLANFRPKIGYPAKWRDYSALSIDACDLFGNVLRAESFAFDYTISQLSGPVDPDEWFMFPQTVNAYYHPLRNEIVFPAAILQPPFFNADADDAVNYGGIGAVIGHEIGHGFDDQGSTCDGDGRLRDWWTPADRAAFEARVSRLVGQYDALRPTEAPDVHVNGALTLGENIGDLGGLVIAYRAWQIHREGTTPDDSPVDGYTPTQRLFLSWAAVHQSAARPEWIRERIATDPHSPDEHRCNQTARNVTAFHDAFGTAPGDGMWLDPADRVTIW